jgi:hypothetical protein
MTTADSVCLGFGLEELPEAQRIDLIRRSLRHLRR